MGSLAGSIPGLAGIVIPQLHCAGSDGVNSLRVFSETAESHLDPDCMRWRYFLWPQCLLTLTQLL